MIDSTRLLVAEDDLRVGSFLVQGLRDEGYDVTWTTTGTDALASARLGEFEIILLDHMLPGMSGVAIAKTLREEGSTTPILMITARDAPEDRQLARDAGVSDFLAKPFLFDDLLSKVAGLLAVN